MEQDDLTAEFGVHYGVLAVLRAGKQVFINGKWVFMVPDNLQSLFGSTACAVVLNLPAPQRDTRTYDIDEHGALIMQVDGGAWVPLDLSVFDNIADSLFVRDLDLGQITDRPVLYTFVDTTVFIQYLYGLDIESAEDIMEDARVVHALKLFPPEQYPNYAVTGYNEESLVPVHNYAIKSQFIRYYADLEDWLSQTGIPLLTKMPQEEMLDLTRSLEHAELSPLSREISPRALKLQEACCKRIQEQEAEAI